VPPVDGEDHNTPHIPPEARFDFFTADFDVDIAPEGIHGVCEMEGFHSFTVLLAYAMYDEDQFRDFGSVRECQIRVIFTADTGRNA
jgi:hypothetical protein